MVQPLNTVESKTLISAEESLPVDFSRAEERVFTERDGKIYIGGELVKSEVLEVLRDQAKYFIGSQILELLDATLKNEAANLAVIQSGNSGSIERDVVSAKMLHHWNFVLQNMILRLANAKVDK